MPADAAYSLTRRKGSPGTIVRVTGTTANPETGDKTESKEEVTVRWMVVEPVQYSRLIRAQAVQQDIGETQITIWTKDVCFSSVSQEDYIVHDCKRFEIVSYVIEGTSFVIFVRETKK
jgi:hypothetical protein